MMHRCGISRARAAAVISEVSDFNRFTSPKNFAAFIGLVPGEQSSGEGIKRTGLTKAGNVHLRREFIEASQSICRGQIGHKSKALAAGQKGCPTEVTAFADKANERLRRKYYRMINNAQSSRRSFYNDLRLSRLQEEDFLDIFKAA